MTNLFCKIAWTKAFGLAFLLAISLAAATPAKAVDLSGCWSGTWQSCTCRHHGPLHATFTKCNEKQYFVSFSGRFFKIMPFHYSVTLDIVEDDGETVKLSGSSYLGRMMGTFTYSAAATACTFNSTYSSCKDWGYFNMTKCCAAPTCCK